MASLTALPNTCLSHPYCPREFDSRNTHRPSGVITKSSALNVSPDIDMNARTLSAITEGTFRLR
jgi:hypothetical protein